MSQVDRAAIVAGLRTVVAEMRPALNDANAPPEYLVAVRKDIGLFTEAADLIEADEKRIDEWLATARKRLKGGDQ